VDAKTMTTDRLVGSVLPNAAAAANNTAIAENRMRRRVVFASILGNGLEWFDFVSYGYFASIIAKVFFPAGSELALMLTYATFAVGFVVRPIGGIVLGAYADRFGRRRALSLLIAMMAFGTLTLGLTPAYATVGIVAPIIVVLGRVVQGISIGGEFASATALLVEYAPANRKMMYGSFQMSSQALGRVLATGIGLPVLLLFPPATIQDGAWRIPFLIGSLIGPFGFYVRYRLAESPEFQRLLEHKKDMARAPVREVLQHHGVPVICAIGLTIIGTSLTYIWNTYLPTYVVEQLHLPLWQGPARRRGHLGGRHRHLRARRLARRRLRALPNVLPVHRDFGADLLSDVRLRAGRARLRAVVPGPIRGAHGVRAAAGLGTRAAGGPVPGRGALHRHGDLLQCRRDRVRRLRAADRHLADRDDGQQAGTGVLHHRRGGAVDRGGRLNAQRRAARRGGPSQSFHSMRSYHA
jgi:MFS family permease